MTRQTRKAGARELADYDPGELTSYQDVVTMIGECRRIESAVQWTIGDLVTRAVHLAPGTPVTETIERLSDDTDYAVGTLESFRTVAEAYPRESRRLDLAWSVYHVFASQPDRAELVTGEWTVKAARAEVTRRKEIDTGEMPLDGADSDATPIPEGSPGTTRATRNHPRKPPRMITRLSPSFRDRAGMPGTKRENS